MLDVSADKRTLSEANRPSSDPTGRKATAQPARLADGSERPTLERRQGWHRDLFIVSEGEGRTRLVLTYDQLIYLKGLIHDEQGTGTADLMAYGLVS